MNFTFIQIFKLCKNGLIIFILLLICTTIGLSQEAEEKSPITLELEVAQGEKVNRDQDKARQKVDVLLEIPSFSVVPQSFNPTIKEACQLKFYIPEPGRVTMEVFGPDDKKIRTLIKDKHLEKGDQSQIWDGRDDNGIVAPDEAYFFTIKLVGGSGKKYLYDPTTFSGGEEFDINSLKIDSEKKSISYILEQSSRVIIRIGIKNGPLLNILGDWLLRRAGIISENWNGKDQDGLIDLWKDQRLDIAAIGYRYPHSSVITFGNKKMDYLQYTKEKAKGFKLKEIRERKFEEGAERISDFYKPYRYDFRAPRTYLIFPELDKDKKKEFKNPIEVNGKIDSRIDIEPRDKTLLNEDQFEIAFYIDGNFIGEEEIAYFPYDLTWDLSNYSDGEHLLTINVIGISGRIGISSRKVILKK